MSQVPNYINRLFFVPKTTGGVWDWVAPGNLKPEEEGLCVIQRRSPSGVGL